MKKVWVVIQAGSHVSVWRTPRGARVEAERLAADYIAQNSDGIDRRTVWGSDPRTGSPALRVESKQGDRYVSRVLPWVVYEEPVQTNVIEDLAALADDE
jgi:hypothetical protein